MALIVAASIGTLTLVLYGLQAWFELDRLADWETEAARRNTAQGEAMIARELLRLDMLAEDHATWDDTYAFVASDGLALDYVRANLVGTTFRTLDINLFLLTDTQGDLVYGSFYDHERAEFIELPSEFLTQLGETAPLVQTPQRDGSLRGLTLLPAGPLLVAARPVLRSDGGGPARGVLIMGAMLDTPRLEALSAAADLGLSVFRVDDPAAMPADVGRAWQALAAGREPDTQAPGPGTIAGYRLLPDLEGRPALLVRVSMDRARVTIGYASLFNTALALIIVNGAGGLLVVVLLNRLLLSRLAELSARVQAIGRYGAASERVEAAGTDEVALLARAINRMLDSLERAAREREHAEAEIRLLARFPEESPAPMLRLSPEGAILYANASGQAMVRALRGEAAPALDADVPVWGAAVEQALATRDRVEAEFVGGGSVFACLFVPVEGAGYLNVYGRDVTAARQMAVELQAQRDFAQQVMDNLGQGLTVTNSRHQFEYVNPAYARMLGYLPEDLIGRSPVEFTHPEDLPRLAEARARRALGAASTYETRLVRRDGSVVHAFITGVPRCRDGEVVGAIAVITDLTERRQAEEQLRLHSAGLEAAANGIVITDRRGVILYVNPAFTTLTGYAPEEILGGTPRRLNSGRQAKGFFKEMWATILAGQTWRGELVNRRKDGSLYTEEMTVAPVRASDGEVSHFVAIKRDVTAARQAQAALRASEEKHRRLIENMADGVAMTDEAGRVVEWNRAQEQITGLAQADALGRPIWEVQAELSLPERRTPSALDQWRAMILQALQTGQIPAAQRTATADIRRPDGARRTVETSIYSIPSSQGWLVSGIIRDITEQKRAEAEIIQLNLELESRVAERTSQLAAANQALEGERVLLAQRVAERTADLSALNAELARAVRAKDEFLASMSHELRTPLNTILGMTEVLLEGLLGPVAPDQQDSLRSIEESGRHLLSLINDILDISKIEAGRMELQFSDVNVAAVGQASLRLIREAAQRKSLKVEAAFDPAVTELRADERRLKQMLVNLLSNACKFTPPGGRLGLEVAGDAEREAVHFTVWDTGIGIAPEDQGRLFQPFVQLDSRLSRQYAGTGLGLSLVRRMAELHGGGVALTSAPGQGSRFTISLPWRRSANGAEAAEPDDADQTGDRWQPPAGNGQPAQAPLVLLAEDNEANIKTFAAALTRRYRLQVARTGREAVAQALEARPDLILMDVQMPEMDGLEATRQIRRQAGLVSVPIIALTALAMNGDRERCLQAGADDYLSKPINLKKLLAAIDARLGQ